MNLIYVAFYMPKLFFSSFPLTGTATPALKTIADDFDSFINSSYIFCNSFETLILMSLNNSSNYGYL